jgi:hypothetical protein
MCVHCESRLYNFLLATLVLVQCSAANAQENLPSAPVLQNPKTGANLAKFFVSGKTPYEFWLACLIGLLGLSIVVTTMVTLSRLENIRPEDIARPIIILSVITGTLILVTVGYSNDQIAPAFGLFGTIIGYMLGRLSPSPVPPSTEVTPKVTHKELQK